MRPSPILLQVTVRNGILIASGSLLLPEEYLLLLLCQQLRVILRLLVASLNIDGILCRGRVHVPLHRVVAHPILVARPDPVLRVLNMLGSLMLLILVSGASALVLGAGLTHLLGAVVELIAYSVVVFAGVNDLLEPIVVAVNLHRVRNYCLNAIVVSHDLN